MTDSPSYADSALMDFFTTSTTNLLAAGQTAGVAHHVALSVVGADRMPDSGYMRAKVAQESRIAGFRARVHDPAGRLNSSNSP